MQKTYWLSRLNVYLLFIGLCCLLETLCFTYLQTFSSIRTLTAVLYFLSGLGICAGSLLFAVNCQKGGVTGKSITPVYKIIIVSVFGIFIGVLLFQFGDSIFAQHPIDYHNADMLPLLRAACNRWLHGEHVYSPVKEVWGGEEIPYLPAMWMPFAPALLVNADIRWVSLILTGAAIAAMLIILSRLKYSTFSIAAPVLMPGIFILIKFYTREENSLFEITEEAIPAFYYFLLFIGLMYESDWLIGIAFALCTLSRFSLLPFLPFFFLWLLLNSDFKRLVKIGAVYAVLLLAMFVLPFFLEKPQFFLDIPHKYTRNIEIFWSVNDFSLQGFRDLGLGYVFGYAHHQLMGVLNWIFLLVLPAAWSYAFMVLKKRYNIRKNIWAMAGFKLSLLVFYNFISLPYLYIFLVPTLISYPLFLAVGREADL